MATFYSSFFSSGLLAPMPHEISGSSPTTPRASQSNLPGALQVDTTPTANDFAPALRSANDILPSRPRSDSQGSSRPSLRRRRSSITVGASPVTPMKSNAAPRGARNSFMAARARSGSESRSQDNTEGTTAAGRMRSGSLGGQMIRNARRMSRKPAPPLPAPAPTAPLPAPPSPLTPRSAALPLPIPIISTTQPPSTPRRPLARRAQTTDNALFLSPYMTPAEEEAGMNFGLGAGDAGVPSSPVYSEPAVCERLGMQVDYPSPVDGPGFVWERPDEAMKEN
ncbi:uncharacterized protein B0H18DRAFT_1119081 [Fomitopsis serialis]|uniref:uncharacterized protein n=1 Tax=Fomitopsis serialis TaxID=139415 RepID=UPI002008E05E|nr:uncharacterized protein B0H18DRAFT_1119081 [Neoantrodia serialis]KAH9926185.1 hypothetical protein B0H18DRAFT_1119081 [Neoantrodia serialis]